MAIGQEVATPDQITFITEVIRNQYPQYMGYMEIPELANAITVAMVRGGSPAEVEAEIYKTEYYKNTPALARAFLLDRVRDPATTDAQIAIQADKLKLQLIQLGIPYDWESLRNFAAFQLTSGISEQQILQEAVLHFGKNLDTSKAGGIIGDSMSGVKAQAYNYGMKISDDQARFFATGLAIGTATQSTVDDYMRDQAKAMYPFIAPYLDQGYTVRQWADPYIQSAASELEINPNTIDLSDPKWGRVLQAYEGSPLPLYDWQRVIRTDPSYGWDKTTGARTTAAQFATSLGKMFGNLGG